MPQKAVVLKTVAAPTAICSYPCSVLLSDAVWHRVPDKVCLALTYLSEIVIPDRLLNFQTVPHVDRKLCTIFQTFLFIIYQSYPQISFTSIPYKNLI